jgi:hypothetical protein
MPVEWFCNVCKTSRAPARLPTHTGVFAGLLEKLESKNSSAFRLPREVREYFEGVRTGPDGEYEEAVPPPVKPSGKGSVSPFWSTPIKLLARIRSFRSQNLGLWIPAIILS